MTTSTVDGGTDPSEGDALVRVRIRAMGTRSEDGSSGAPAVRSIAGTVLETSGTAAGWTPGDEVFGWTTDDRLSAGDALVDGALLLPRPGDLPWAVAGTLYSAAERAFDAVRAIGPHPIMAVAVTGADSPEGLIAGQLLQATHAHAVAVVDGRFAPWFRDRGMRVAERGPGLLDAIRAAAPHGLAALVDLDPDSGIDSDAFDLEADQVFTVRTGIRVRGREPHPPGRPTGTTAVLDRISGLIGAGLIDVPVAAELPLGDERRAAENLRTERRLGVVALVADAAAEGSARA